jgi:hypothetical protein
MKRFLKKPLASCLCTLCSKKLAVGTSHMCKKESCKKKSLVVHKSSLQHFYVSTCKPKYWFIIMYTCKNHHH